MKQNLILYPLVAMFLLTGVVWTFMYMRRITYILQNRIKLQSIATPELLNSALPSAINYASNNLKNLFELPVIFYVMCLLLLHLQQVDECYLLLAWAYVILRGAHSLIHCIVNIVSLRFAAYFLSSLVLWFMVGRLASDLV